MQEINGFVSKKPEAACKAGVLALFHVNFWKNRRWAIFGHFDKISGHPRVIFADAK